MDLDQLTINASRFLAVVRHVPRLPSVTLAIAALASCSCPPASRSPALTILPASASDLIALAAKPGASATLVNVWATWCIPCREEFPDLLRLERRYRARGLRLVLVSADFDSATARAFLVKQGVAFPTYFKTGDDMGFINTLSPRWSGALPATFLYDGAGRLVRFWEGKADHRQFERAVRDAMDRTDRPHPKEKTR
jgi:thiol-disulfide isomerase/thioredoxin